MYRNLLVQLVDRCIEDFRAGAMTEASLLKLRGVLDRPSGQRQHLLYLQAETSSVESSLLGMSMVVDGEVDDGPEDPDGWPYKCVLDAMGDGWRVIGFPDLGRVINMSEPQGAVCDFILEKWD